MRVEIYGRSICQDCQELAALARDRGHDVEEIEADDLILRVEAHEPGTFTKFERDIAVAFKAQADLCPVLVFHYPGRLLPDVLGMVGARKSFRQRTCAKCSGWYSPDETVGAELELCQECWEDFCGLDFVMIGAYGYDVSIEEYLLIDWKAGLP